MVVRVGKGHRARSAGQALVEFAIIAPVLFLLFVGIIEAGRLVYYYHMVNNAAREGARYAIVHGENAIDGCPSGPVPFGVSACDPAGNNIKTRILNAAVDLDPSGFTFGWPGDSSFPIYSAPDGTGDPTNRIGNNVTIHVRYSYAPILPVDFFGTISINGDSTLVINN